MSKNCTNDGCNCTPNSAMDQCTDCQSYRKL